MKLQLISPTNETRTMHCGSVSNHLCGHNHESLITGTTEPLEDGFLNLLKRIVPLEKSIKELKTGNQTILHLSMMVANLAPALFTSELGRVFNFPSLLSAPLAVSAMHFSNRGFDKKHLIRWGLTAGSTLGVNLLQQFANLPKILIRPIMALAVFFIEKTNKNQSNHNEHEHDADGKCIHHNHNEHGKSTHSHKESLITKKDWLKLSKLQLQINTVPALVNLITGSLKELNNKTGNIFKQFISNAGISALQISGLSVGFFGAGKLIDKMFSCFSICEEHGNSKKDQNTTITEATAEACACCGAPICVAEAAAESAAEASTLSMGFADVASMSIAQMGSLFGILISAIPVLSMLFDSSKQKDYLA